MTVDNALKENKHDEWLKEQIRIEEWNIEYYHRERENSKMKLEMYKRERKNLNG